MGRRVKTGIKLRISCSDTMLNYRLSQKLKLLGYGEFNHLTIILIDVFNYVWYVLICFFSLGLCSFHILKHVRLFVSLVFVFALFLCLWVSSGLGFLGTCLRTHNYVCARGLEVCVCIPLAHIRRLKYVHACFSSETLIQVFFAFFSLFPCVICLYFGSFYVFGSLFLCLIFCFPLTC